MPTRKLRLQISMVPKTLFGRNLRNELGKHRWRNLRATLLPKKLKCETCGANVHKSSDLKAHEKWKYKVSKKGNVAQLTGISFQCNLCHGCEHFGRTLQLVDNLEVVISHFCKVNRVRRHTFSEHFKTARKVWNKRSRLEWSVDYGGYQVYLDARAYFLNRPKPKLFLDPEKDSESPQSASVPRRGRPPLFGRAMTGAELVTRARHLKRLQAHGDA